MPHLIRSSTLGYTLRRACFLWAVVSVILGASTGSFAQPAAVSKRVLVGTRVVPPFVIQNENGTLKGISIDLWEGVARDLGITYQYQIVDDLNELLKGITTSTAKYDVIVGAVSARAERERTMDFSHPYYASGLAIATKVKNPNAGFLQTLNLVLFNGLLKTLAWLFGAQLVAGMVIYFLESRTNPAHFGGGLLKGIGNGLWWSAVTMATVGYGDKAPRGCLGRLFGIFWMFTSIVIISTFTASITSSLTLSTLQTEGIGGPEDLPNLRVGTYGSASTSHQYLAVTHRVNRLETYASISEGLKATQDGQIDAFVYDAPMLSYYINRDYKDKLYLMPKLFEPQDYSFAFPEGSPLREEVNRELEKEIADPSWQDTLTEYLGKQ